VHYSVHRDSGLIWCTESFSEPTRTRFSADQQLLVTDANPIRKHKKAVEHGTSYQRPLLRQKIKKDSKGLVPIYIRITVNGQRLEHSIQRYVEPSQWSARAGRVKASNDQSRQINLYLDSLNGEIQKLEREMTLDGVQVNFSTFREKWLGLTEAPRMLMEIFQQHNDQMAALIEVGKNFAPGTLERYNTCRDHIRSFIQWKFGMEDIDIKRLNFEFASELEFWLKTERSCAHNTTMKYISNLKKIMNSCLRKGWLAKDPVSSPSSRPILG
jgi:hypothetical protein